MRHGETEWNAAGRLQGGLDAPLTRLGRQQARRQAQLLRGVPPHVARYCAPAGRAVATAQIAFGGQGFTRDDRLREIGIGGFAGRKLCDLARENPMVFAGEGTLDWYDRIPDGEGFAVLEARARAFLADLRGPAIIVTHGITLRMLRLVAMGRSLDQIARHPVFQGAVHHVARGEERVLY